MTREFTPNKAQGAVEKGLADGNHDAAAMLATFIRTSGDSMTLRSLRPLDCSMRMIFCALSMCLTFSRTLAGAQAATVAEAEQDADLEAAGHGQQARVSSGLITCGIFWGLRM